MNDTEQIVETLRLIWNELKTVNTNLSSRLDQTNASLEQVRTRIDETNARLDETRTELGSRLERVEQGLTDLGKFMGQIALDQAKHERFHSQHVNVIESDVSELKERVKRLEERLGP